MRSGSAARTKLVVVADSEVVAKNMYCGHRGNTVIDEQS
jgi:hypothetical protein